LGNRKSYELVGHYHLRDDCLLGILQASQAHHHGAGAALNGYSN